MKTRSGVSQKCHHLKSRIKCVEILEPDKLCLEIHSLLLRIDNTIERVAGEVCTWKLGRY